MKILAIADEESKYLWDYFEKSKLEGIDLIISCGDLDPRYLSFLATFTSAPVLYVHGNHDDKYERIPPEGCICIDDKLFVYEGIRILGLGGSMRYKPGVHQYTEWEIYRPKYFLHGHVHMSYGRKHKRYDKYEETNVINAFDRCVFEFEAEEPEKQFE